MGILWISVPNGWSVSKEKGKEIVDATTLRSGIVDLEWKQQKDFPKQSGNDRHLGELYEERGLLNREI